MIYKVLDTVTINKGFTDVEPSYVRVGYVIAKYSWGEELIKPCTWDSLGKCSIKGYDANIEPLPEPYFV